MKTYAERIEEERARHAGKLAELEMEAAIAAQLPYQGAPPDYIHFASKSEPWVSYKVAAIGAALPILSAFTPLAGDAAEAGCLYVGPHAMTSAGDRARQRWHADQLVEVTLDHGRGFQSYGLGCWARLADKVVRVKIEVASWPWKARPSCRVSYNNHGEVSRAEHTLAPMGEWQRVKWGAGSLDSCRWSLYFNDHARALDWLRALDVAA